MFGIGLGIGFGLVLVVFLRSRLCLLHENDDKLFFEIAMTVPNGSRLRKGKLQWRPHQVACILVSPSLGSISSDYFSHKCLSIVICISCL